MEDGQIANRGFNISSIQLCKKHIYQSEETFYKFTMQPNTSMRIIPQSYKSLKMMIVS